MTIYAFYIFDRHCQCIYHQKWNTSMNSNMNGNNIPDSRPSQGGSTMTSTLAATSATLPNTTGLPSELNSLSSQHSSFMNNQTTGGMNQLNSNYNNGMGQSDSSLMGSTNFNLPGTNMNNGPKSLLTNSSGMNGSVSGLDGVGGLAGTSGMKFEEEAKLVFGVVFSLKNMVSKLMPSSEHEGFTAYKTNNYKLHFYETPSNIRFVLLTDPYADTSPMRDALKYIYSSIYVDYVMKNPIVKRDSGYIQGTLFSTAIQRYLTSLSQFN